MPRLSFPSIAPEKIVLTRVVDRPIDYLFFLELREAANLSSKFNIVIRSFETTVLAFSIDDLRTRVLFSSTKAHLQMRLKAADYFLKLIDMGVTENKSGNWPGLKCCEIRNGLEGEWEMLTSSSLSLLGECGTPSHPEYTSSVYVYELFNEDLRSSAVPEANWGLFYANSTHVYLLHVSGSVEFLANDTTNQTYCVVMDGVDGKTLQTTLDWACGPGRANCSEIQLGENCYQPNNVKNHASYAFDSYYEKQGRSARSCDFKGVAMITTYY
nr:glucan endo-1,3-beta-glucosidase 1 [Tanacetum cinerariifolium]